MSNFLSILPYLRRNFLRDVHFGSTGRGSYLFIAQSLNSFFPSSQFYFQDSSFFYWPKSHGKIKYMRLVIPFTFFCKTVSLEVLWAVLAMWCLATINTLDTMHAVFWLHSKVHIFHEKHMANLNQRLVALRKKRFLNNCMFFDDNAVNVLLLTNVWWDFFLTSLKVSLACVEISFRRPWIFFQAKECV